MYHIILKLKLNLNLKSSKQTTVGRALRKWTFLKETIEKKDYSIGKISRHGQTLDEQINIVKSVISITESFLLDFY